VPSLTAFVEKRETLNLLPVVINGVGGGERKGFRGYCYKFLSFELTDFEKFTFISEFE